MNWDIPQEPNYDLLQGHPFLLWMFKFYNSFRRVDYNYTRVTSITADYTATIDDCVILVDATSAAVTITLPLIADLELNKVFYIKKIDSSSNAVTIDGNGSETIDDSLTLIITAQYDCPKLVTDESAWFII